MHIENKDKKLVEIIVYGDNRVELRQNGELVPCTEIKFSASIDCIPELTTTQLICNRHIPKTDTKRSI